MNNINNFYTVIYNYLENDKGSKNGKYLYDLYSKTITNYYNINIIPSLKDSNINIFISKLIKFYNCNKTSIKYFNNLLFRYLDRYYIQTNNLPSLEIVSWGIFKKTIFDYYKDNIILHILTTTQTYRNTKKSMKLFEIQPELVYVFEMINRFDLLNNDESIIYKQLVNDTKNYFQNYNSQICNLEHEEYFNTLYDVYNKELNMYVKILNNNLYNDYIKQINIILIKNNINKFQNSNYIISLFSNTDTKNLKKIYYLLNQIQEEKEILVPLMEKSIEDKIYGFQNISNLEDFINNIISFYNQYIDLLNIFKKSFYFIKILKTKLTNYLDNGDIEINSKKINFIRIYVNHINYYITKRPDNLDNNYLNQYFNVFDTIQDKDLYLELYSKFLCKRLLLNNTDIDVENEIIRYLKRLCGLTSTIKIESMIKDTILNNINNKNNDYYKYQILTESHWPSYDNKKCQISEELSNIMKNYETHYNSKYSNRTINWNHNLSTVTFNLNLDKTYSITSTIIEFEIINLFSKSISYSFNNIKEQLKLDINILEMYLKNLLFYKLIIVENINSGDNQNNEDNESDFNSETIISFNQKYKNKKIKIILENPTIKNSKKDNKNKEIVEEQRVDIIKANIVKIMKTKKILSYNNLIIEVNKNISIFKPQVKTIKKCIEILIDREYLERSTKDYSILNYLA
jgi:cullin 1